ncbi:MAG: hypothetical protein JW894_00570 [Bacteroidales bacterium]|nr:hypothetical protein [Bacteroidales bacterium]
MRQSYIFYAFLLLISISCKHTNKKITDAIIIKQDSIYGELIADTIIYDVVIRNPDQDDLWETERLKLLQHSRLVDSLFKMVYEEKVTAYDFFTNKVMKVMDVKKMEQEEGFTRDKIGKIQFTERWYFSSTNGLFQKEVISVVLGYEVEDDNGFIRGYKPVFKLFLNH